MAPRNAYPACLLAENDRIGRDYLDLLHQSHVNPLGLSALCLPREIHISDSAAYFTGALCSLLHWGSMLCALCALRSAPCPLPSSPSASSAALLKSRLAGRSSSAAVLKRSAPYAT